MSSAVVGGAGAAAASGAAAIAQAIKASGAIVLVEPRDFLTLLSKSENPLVVVAKGGLVRPNYQYLTGYRGLVFFTKSASALQLGGTVELVEAKRIWIPG